MGNGNAPTLQSMCFCEENCRQTYTDWIAVSPETTETGVADLFYTVLFNGDTMSNYITTYTGKHFEPANPDSDKICIEDIAHALSLICRGNGHVKTFWSVGQHCIFKLERINITKNDEEREWLA